MPTESELIARVQSYLAGDLTFKELASWVDQYESVFFDMGLESTACSLTGAVLLALYEMDHGDHTEQSLHESVAAHFAEIVGSRTPR